VVFIAAAEHPPDPEQRVVGVPAMSQRLLLDAAADLVQRFQPEPHDVEGVQHPGGVGQGDAQCGGVAAERG
jgi:hypothetical protein